MKLTKIFIVPALFIGNFVCAQQGHRDYHPAEIEQIIELISENQETEDLDFTTLLDDLTFYYHHPIDLNFATRQELASLVLLDAIQVQSILTHIQKTGRFESVYELQAIEGMDEKTVRAILPFVKAGNTKDRRSFNPKDIWKEAKNEAFIRHQRTLEEMEGYAEIDPEELEESPNRRYLGSPEKLLFRYRFKYYDNLSLGITSEKDAGEEFFQGTQPQGFDFNGFHFYLGNYGKLKHFALGDFQVQFGQGLTYWSGLAFGKSGNIASVVRNARAISPHVSAEENNFMRGAGATFEIGKIEVTGFASRKRRDANLNEPDTLFNDLDENYSQSTPVFSSIQSSGFHRTPGEVSDKNSIRETNAGGHLRYRGHNLEIGATYVFTQFGGKYNRNTAFYNQFENTNPVQHNTGLDYKYFFRNFLLFGEVAKSSNGAMALLSGAVASLAPGFDVALLYRNYATSYTSLRSTAFSEGSRNLNEKGLYTGFNAKLNSKWSLVGYYDLFRFPWLRFRVDSPSFGYDFMAQMNYSRSKTFKAYGRFRMENKSLNHRKEGAPLYEIKPQQKIWYRLHLDYKISKTITLRNRIEWVRVHQMSGDTSNGCILYQDINMKPLDFPLSFHLRYAIFETDDYDSRIYTYENDVLYSFSVPAFYNRGSRFYFLLKYRINRHVDLSARISQTYYANAKENGSGLNVIQKPHRTEVKTQLRIRF